MVVDVTDLFIIAFEAVTKKIKWQILTFLTIGINFPQNNEANKNDVSHFKIKPDIFPIFGWMIVWYSSRSFGFYHKQKFNFQFVITSFTQILYIFFCMYFSVFYLSSNLSSYVSVILSVNKSFCRAVFLDVFLFSLCIFLLT